MKLNIKKTLFLVLLGSVFVSCSDFLDKEPPSTIVPTDYYTSEDQVQACANAFYADILLSHTYNSNSSYGIFGHDTDTDNQAGVGAVEKYASGQKKVGMDNSNWSTDIKSWGGIRNINYQLNAILERYDKKEISGSDKNIRQYIGELYFLRSYAYFQMLMFWGDLPIITEAFPDNEAILVAANKRSPRNEVARFILKDLDEAIGYMSDGFETRRTRISRDAAILMKSRVALFEGSWLTNFKGTAFVPNGEGWPGKSKDYNANYQYPEGSIENEIKFFLEVAVASGEIIAEKYKNDLVKNTGTIPQSLTDPENPYFKLFGNTDMTEFKEVLLWREYSRGLGVQNQVETAVNRGNMGRGLTRGLVESFLMADGKPIYAQHNGYTYNDGTITSVRSNRDPRLIIFLKEPDQKNVFKNMDDRIGDMFIEIEPKPDITNGAGDRVYPTGYALRKGGTFDKALAGNNKGYTASITFRATEALLNYVEAQYMLTGNIGSGKILEYWKTIREKAGFNGDAIDPQTTIAATDITKEALDWGAYTAGQLLTDPVLYNIRRERRCELMAEGLRWMDLIRWRALEQMIKQPYHIEGFHLWNTPMESWYSFSATDYDGSSSAKVSSPTLSEYLRPYEKNMTTGNLFRNGYTWSMAQYLEPLPVKQFLLTAPDYISVDQSPLYQNPYWPIVADEPAEK
ncbi:RagB/SusD family nutrient uptake outer membrane protein [Bacteroides sp. 51]|uniref:RagB/SusD family nutrient uptake outer membrane protein n=1 Tax=Bacteroides sp. 51 TaxID=2302938 RepID=UPI0013D076D3|nr:RagB/SusD family nutrient uptake outer membrane protein [Bacteroides sp. 51]NDV80500.1 RagB/SusD family nutrient uptake outer membrane protein [Bacteroides sp. 51]